MFSIVFSLLGDIFTDTLTKEGKWSRMNIMMFICFNTAILMAWVDFIQHGLRLDVWVIIISLAYSTKLIDAKAKKMQV
jgi:hypothetical protein